MNYGLTSENMELIDEKAHVRKDGVYTFRGVYYRVIDRSVTHYAVHGDVFKRIGTFITQSGSYDWPKETGRDVLKSI